MNEFSGASRYLIERTLGGGGMATVYLARDEELRREVALKVLGAHVAQNEEMRSRFLREARLAARLSHPNVVQVFDVGETADGLPFIVMEYVPGKTLAQRGKVPPAEAVSLALQACAGLQHAHDAGLIHRDVKPANLLVREDRVLKVADFGIARTVAGTQLTQAGTILGTAAYLAPEQALGEAATTTSDVYALGAVTYELLTGRPPHLFDSLAELARLQGGGLITPVRDLEPAVPEPVEAVVMSCLARDPAFRPQSMSEVADGLARATDVPTEPLLATAVTEPLQSRRYESVPGAGVWLLVAAAAVAAVIGVVLGLLELGRDSTQTRERPPTVAPPARGASPADEARNLSEWLRRYSR